MDTMALPKFIEKPLRLFKRSRVVHLLFAVAFFTSGLIINFLQFLAFITVKPFSKKTYRTLMYYICYFLNSQLVFLGAWWAPTKVKLYISPEDLELSKHNHGLLLMNHSYEVDWLMGWLFCDYIGILGNCKAFAKKVIQYIPVVGWSWKFAEYIFLERSFDKDKIMIGKQLDEVFDYPHTTWLLLNAEGTRFTEEKHKASVAFAKERGMPVLHHHLIPRTKGFTTSLPFLRKKCKYVVDVQLAFDENAPVAPTITNLLFGKQIEAHLYIRMIKIDEIPETEEGAAEWLQELFRHKDRMQQSFHKTGDFFKESGVTRVPVQDQPRRVQSLANTLIWTTIVLTPMLGYLCTLIFSGKLIYIVSGALVLGIFYVLMQRSINMSKIKLGSKYGAKDTTTKDNGTGNHRKEN